MKLSQGAETPHRNPLQAVFSGLLQKRKSESKHEKDATCHSCLNDGGGGACGEKWGTSRVQSKQENGLTASKKMGT